MLTEPRTTMTGVVAFCCLMVVVTAGGYVTYQLLDGDDPAPVEGARSSSQAAPLEPAPSASPPTGDPREGPGESTWRSAARVYGEAFTDTTAGRAAWLSRMEDLSSPTLAEGYRSTDLTAVPTAAFLRFSGGQVVAGETPSRAVRLHYAGGLAIDITISQDPTTDRWVITTAAPAQGPPPGEPSEPGEPGNPERSNGPQGRVVA